MYLIKLIKLTVHSWLPNLGQNFFITFSNLIKWTEARTAFSFLISSEKESSYMKIYENYCMNLWMVGNKLNLLIYLINPYLAGNVNDQPFVTIIEPAQLVHSCSLTRLYTVSWPTSNLIILISLKMIMENDKNGRWNISYMYKEFIRLSSTILTYLTYFTREGKTGDRTMLYLLRQVPIH